MNCSEFKKEMKNFINNSVDDDNIEAFIQHYKSCKECNEELEIYYMINKTFNHDAPDSNTVSIAESYDFKSRLNSKINYYEELIYNRYKKQFFLKIAFWSIELISAGMAVYFIMLFFGGNNVW